MQSFGNSISVPGRTSITTWAALAWIYPDAQQCAVLTVQPVQRGPVASHPHILVVQCNAALVDLCDADEQDRPVQCVQIITRYPRRRLSLVRSSGA